MDITMLERPLQPCILVLTTKVIIVNSITDGLCKASNILHCQIGMDILTSLTSTL